MNEKGVDLDSALDGLAEYHGQFQSAERRFLVLPQSIQILATPKISKRSTHWISAPVARDTEILTGKLETRENERRMPSKEARLP